MPISSVTSRSLLLPVLVAAGLAACGESNTNNPTGAAGTVAAVAGSSGSGGSAGTDALAGSAGNMAGTANIGGSAGAGGSMGGSGGAGGGNTMPTLLSETGLYSDIKTKTLAAVVHPFTPAYKLWSDGADKNRYVYMPPGGKIITDDMEYWQYPAGFKLWKDFTRDGKLIETRLLQKISGGLADWYMVAFKWNADGSEATALPMGEQNAMGTMHDIPSKEDCKGCHTSMKDNSLGFTAVLLSHNLPNSLNLTQIDQMGWLSTPAKAGGYTLPGDEPTKAALGYLQANCGMCHNYKSNVYKTKVTLDLWAHLDKLDTVQGTFAYLSMVCDQWPGPDKFNPITACEAGHATGAMMDTDISKLKRVAPGMAAESGIHDLMALRATGQAGMMKQMPPLGSEITDPTGLGVVDAWINSLPAQ